MTVVPLTAPAVLVFVGVRSLVSPLRIAPRQQGLFFRQPGIDLGTDAAHLQHVAKMEGIVCGPGGRYNTMPDERVDIPDFLDMIRVYMLAILDICEAA